MGFCLAFHTKSRGSDLEQIVYHDRKIWERIVFLEMLALLCVVVMGLHPSDSPHAPYIIHNFVIS